MSRKPKLAKKIFKILAVNHLLSVQDLLDNLNHNEKNYNKTSVYRALERLVEAKLVCKQIFNDEARFELRQDHHDHAICQDCNKIEVVECKNKKQDIPGFKVDHHHTVVYGVCDDCV